MITIIGSRSSESHVLARVYSVGIAHIIINHLRELHLYDELYFQRGARKKSELTEENKLYQERLKV